MNKEDLLTQERLKQLLDYDPATGKFTWKSDKYCRKIGEKAGYLFRSEGYWIIKVEGGVYKAHRLAWFFTFGKWPRHGLDHIDRDKLNNAILNLREATDAENAQNRSLSKNNTTGYAGVTFYKLRGDYAARIGYRGKIIHIGYFDTIELAADAYAKMKKKLHTFSSEARAA